MKIYIASSWRHQHAVEMLTTMLRDRNHQVLSFVEENYKTGKGAEKGVDFEEWVHTESAQESFKFDTTGAMTSDLVVYIGASGKDAAAELGMAWAKGVPIYGLYSKGEDFGLMRKIITWFERFPQLLNAISEYDINNDASF